MKVAVHHLPYITRKGYSCFNHFRFHVFSGINPVGPRGGFSGNCVSGTRISGPHRTYADAKLSAMSIAAEKGYKLVC